MKQYILALISILYLAACSGETYKSMAWTLTDADLCIRRGEVYRLPFKGGSADYSIDNDSPETAEVMTVLTASQLYPGHNDQSLVIHGRKTGEAKVRVRDNKSRNVVLYRLRVVNPYIALTGSVKTNPQYRDSLLAWDTDLYLRDDGRFLLTTFTDGMPVKPALIARGTYVISDGNDGKRLITLTTADLAVAPQTYVLPDSGALAEILATWDIDRPDSDLDLCMLPNTSGNGSARYWVTPSQRLPDGLAF